MSKNEMTERVRELKELKALAEELNREIISIEDALKAEMTARGTDEMQVDIFKIRWARVKSKRFDSASFKKAMPVLYEQFTKQSETRRFTVA